MCSRSRSDQRHAQLVKNRSEDPAPQSTDPHSPREASKWPGRRRPGSSARSGATDRQCRQALKGAHGKPETMLAPVSEKTRARHRSGRPSGLRHRHGGRRQKAARRFRSLRSAECGARAHPTRGRGQLHVRRPTTGSSRTCIGPGGEEPVVRVRASRAASNPGARCMIGKDPYSRARGAWPSGVSANSDKRNHWARSPGRSVSGDAVRGFQ